MLRTTNRLVDNHFGVPNEFRQTLQRIQLNQIPDILIDDTLLALFKCRREDYERFIAEQMTLLGDALASNTSVSKLTLSSWMFPAEALAGLVDTLKKNRTIATLKINIFSPQTLPALADVLAHNIGLKYFSIVVNGESGNQYLPQIAKALENHRTVLSVEIIDDSNQLNNATLQALKNTAALNKNLMSFALITGNENRRDFCQEIRDAELGCTSVAPVVAPAPLPVIIADRVPAPVMPQDLQHRHIEQMIAPEVRAAEMQAMLAPELRAHDLERTIEHAQHYQEQQIRDAERKINQDIENAISQQSYLQEQQMHDMERRMAQSEQAMRDIELRMTRDAQAGRLQFGLMQPVSAPQPKQIIIPKPKRVPFTDDEITLIHAYLENIYEHSNSAIEKRTIDNLRCPISLEIMGDPVFLGTDGATYDRKCLLRQLASGNNASPKTRRPFTLKDMGQDFGVISMLQQFLEDAVKEKSRLEQSQMNCKP
jgi:hypothetical protein